MKLLLMALCLSLAVPVLAQSADSCRQFDVLVSRTYNFKFPGAGLSETQMRAREANLDRFWTTVQGNKVQFLPCLSRKVADARANPFFRFDGANLLVTLQPSSKSKQLQVAVYQDTTLPLFVINAERWVATLTLRGAEGFDVSKAAKRALEDKTVTYTPSNIIPEYADESLSNTEAAFFLWNSQSEERVTPELFALAKDPKYPQREQALSFLALQGTSQSRQLIKKLNRDSFSSSTLKLLDNAFKAPLKRAQPKITRAQFLAAFNSMLTGNPASYGNLLKKVPDLERDAVSVLTPADVPLLRRVRRRVLVGCNRNSMNFYFRLTALLFAVVDSQNA